MSQDQTQPQHKRQNPASSEPTLPLDSRSEVRSKRGGPAVRPRRDIFDRYFPEESAGRRPISTTIAKPQSEIFAILRDVGNFPSFFENLERVEVVNPELSNWHFKGDEKFAMPMQIESNLDGDLFVWKSLDAAGFVYTLAIHLEPAQAGRGTVVRMLVSYDEKTGAIAGMFEKLFGADALINSKKNLQRLKAFCETGHVPTTDGQPSGRDEDQSTSVKH
jgi:uncharacterized membrane protein